MSNVTLVLPLHLRDDLAAAAAGAVETGFVLLVSVAEHAGSVRLLGGKLHPVPRPGYLSRDIDGMTVTPVGYLAALARAEDIGAAALWVHTHPGPASSPRPSGKDAEVDRQLAGTFRIRTGQPWYGAVVFAVGDCGHLAFSGHAQREDRNPIAVGRLCAEVLDLLFPELHTPPGRTRQRTPGRGQARTLPRLRPWHQPASVDVLTHDVRLHVARTD